jgi:hypothetical protein
MRGRIHSLVSQRSPHVVPAILAGIAFLLVVVGRLVERYAAGSPILEVLIPAVDLNGEANIPAWYSTLLWIIAAHYSFQLGILDSAGRKKQFILLSVLFLFLSLDEAASLHEKTEKIFIILNGSELSGLLSFEWVLFGIAFLIVSGLVFLPLLLSLGWLELTIISIAALTFLTGALGLEMVQAAALDGTLSVPGWISRRLSLAEEFLEMLGVVILIDGLLVLLQSTSRNTGRRRGVAAATRTEHMLGATQCGASPP